MKPKLSWLIVFTFVLSATATMVAAQDKVDFVKQIVPILEKHCMECHNENGDQYAIEDKEVAFDYITEGSPEDSEMFNVLVSEEEDYLMPPPDFERPLSAEQIDLVKRWIEEGAEWPEDATFTMWKPEIAETDVEDVDPEKPEEAPVTNSVDPRIYGAIGSLHPAILHLPMGLLLGAGFFALLSLRGNFVMSDCAYYCLWLGVLTGILACATGWYFSETSGTGVVAEFNDLFDQKQKIFWHRTSALICTAFGLLLALFAMSARSRDPDEGATWKLGAIILAAGIGYVGMTGGKLVHKSHLYKDLYSLWTEWTGMGEEEAAEPAAKPEGDSDADDNSNVGETSEVI